MDNDSVNNFKFTLPELRKVAADYVEDSVGNLLLAMQVWIRQRIEAQERADAEIFRRQAEEEQRRLKAGD